MSAVWMDIVILLLVCGNPIWAINDQCTHVQTFLHCEGGINVINPVKYQDVASRNQFAFIIFTSSLHILNI